MLTLMRIGLFIVLLLPMLVTAGPKPVIRIVSQEIPGFANADGTGTYWEIIRATLSASYQLQLYTAPLKQIKKLELDAFADVIVHFDGDKRLKNTLFSDQHIDISYPIHFLTRPENINNASNINLDKKTIGISTALNKLNLLPNSTQTYIVPSVEGLAKLVHKQRLDGILTFSYNIHFVDPNRTLSHILWKPESKIRLAFQNTALGLQLANEFDIEMLNLSKSNKLREMFNKEANYLHAHYQQYTPDSKLNWHLIPKKFSEDSKQLEALDYEVFISDYISNQIESVDFDIKVNSSRVAIEGMRKVENHCTLNLMKTPEREDFAYFSEPSYVFLPPRLYTLKNSVLGSKLTNAAVTATLPELVRLFPSARIALNKHQNTMRTLTNAYGNAILEDLYPVEDNSLRNILTLLLTKRADAIIIWPTHIPSLIGDKEVANLLTSVPLAPFNESLTYSYVACTKNDIGKKVILQINNLLKDRKHQKHLFGGLLEQMDESSAKAFKEKLQLTFE